MSLISLFIGLIFHKIWHVQCMASPIFEILISNSRGIKMKELTNLSDVFTNLSHEFFSVWTVEKEKNFGPKHFYFFQFAGWKRNHNEYLFTNFVDSEFKIGETIWRIRSITLKRHWPHYSYLSEPIDTPLLSSSLSSSIFDVRFDSESLGIPLSWLGDHSYIM